MTTGDKQASDYWQRINKEQEARNRAVLRQMPFYFLAAFFGNCLFRAVGGAAAAWTGHSTVLGNSPRDGLIWASLALAAIVAAWYLRRYRRGRR